MSRLIHDIPSTESLLPRQPGLARLTELDVGLATGNVSGGVSACRLPDGVSALSRLLTEKYLELFESDESARRQTVVFVTALDTYFKTVSSFPAQTHLLLAPASHFLFEFGESLILGENLSLKFDKLRLQLCLIPEFVVG